MIPSFLYVLTLIGSFSCSQPIVHSSQQLSISLDTLPSVADTIPIMSIVVDTSSLISDSTVVAKVEVDTAVGAPELSFVPLHSVEDTTISEATRVCQEFSVSILDTITRKVIHKSKDPVILLNRARTAKFEVFLSRNGFEIILLVKNRYKMCFDNDQDVSLLLTSGEELFLKSTNPGNCSGQLSLSFGGIYGQLPKLMRLANDYISQIKFADREGKTFHLQLNEKKQRALRSTLDCVMSSEDLTD